MVASASAFPRRSPAGTIGSPQLLPGWANLAPPTSWPPAGVPVVVNNDANLGALGEYTWGAGRGFPALVYIKLATGIGAGIVLDGQLYVGAPAPPARSGT